MTQASRIYLLFIVMLITGGLQLTHAGTIVQWGASGGEEIATGTSYMTYSGISTLQTNTPANPDLGENGYYSGHSTDRSWKFYQAMTGASEATIYHPNFISDDDYLVFQDMAGTTDPLTTVLFWEKADFLNGMNNAEEVSLSSLYMEAATDDDQASFRWMVQDVGGSFYLSSLVDIANNGGSSFGAYELTSLSSTSWFAFDPETDIGTVGSLVTGLMFDDIAGVGFRAYTDAGSSHDYIKVRDFEVTAIPEPGTVLLLIPGLGALAAWRRRDGLRIGLPSKSGGLMRPGFSLRHEGKGFGAVLERLSRLITSLTPRFACSLNFPESDRLLRGFDRTETLLRGCGERISTACNRTADRLWNLILR